MGNARAGGMVVTGGATDDADVTDYEAQSAQSVQSVVIQKLVTQKFTETRF